jgi:hypothetical protein
MLYPALATLAFALLVAGFALRARGRGRHAALMSAGMALDLGLVLTLELTKNAFGTVVGGGLSPAQAVHVGASSLALLLYFPVFALGWVRLFHPSGANLALRAWHRRLGYVALAFRTVGFFFLFAMLGRP